MRGYVLLLVAALLLCGCDLLTEEQKASALEAVRQQLAEGSISQQTYDAIVEAITAGRPWYEALLEAVGLILGGGLTGLGLARVTRGPAKPMTKAEADRLRELAHVPGSRTTPHI